VALDSNSKYNGSNPFGNTKLIVMARTDTFRINEAMDFESDTKNWKYPFERMCKFYGKDFIECIKSMWIANGDSQTEDEFCEMNDLPKKFFEKVVK
jgi:hypothetical protein